MAKKRKEQGVEEVAEMNDLEEYQEPVIDSYQEDQPVDPEVSSLGTILYSDLEQTNIRHNMITESEFNLLKSKFPRLFCTILGMQNDVSLYIFKPLQWKKFKHIRALKDTDKDSVHEMILSECLVSPVVRDTIACNSLDAGIVIILVQQIMAISGFLSTPESAMSLVVPINL